MATWPSTSSPPFPLLLLRPLSLRMLSRMLLAIELPRLARLLIESARPMVWSERGSHVRTTIHGRCSLPVTYSPDRLLWKQQQQITSPATTSTTSRIAAPTAIPMIPPIGKPPGTEVVDGCVVPWVEADWNWEGCVHVLHEQHTCSLIPKVLHLQLQSSTRLVLPLGKVTGMGLEWP